MKCSRRTFFALAFSALAIKPELRAAARGAARWLTLTELITTTICAHSAEVAANVTRGNALLRKLQGCKPAPFYLGYELLSA